MVEFEAVVPLCGCQAIRAGMFYYDETKKYNYKADAVRSENRESYATWESLEILVTFAPV